MLCPPCHDGLCPLEPGTQTMIAPQSCLSGILSQKVQKLIVQKGLPGIAPIAETPDYMILRPLEMICKRNVEELAALIGRSCGL